MRGFKLAPLRLDLSSVGYDTLGDVERSMVIFRETQDDVDFVFKRTSTDFLHFGGTIAQRVADVCDGSFHVDWSGPVSPAQY